MTPGLRRRRIRIAYWCWALILFTGTHWPNLRIPGEHRPDLWVHLSIFGLWGSLLIASGYFGPPLSWKNISVVFASGVVYAAVDELLQAIPFVHRTCALDDWALDCTGIALACLGAIALRIRNAPRAPAT